MGDRSTGQDGVPAGGRTPLWRRTKKRLKHGYVRLLRSPGAPKEIARGMALGLFLAMLPIIQTPVALGLVEILRRAFRTPVSRVAAVIGCCFTNPLTGGLLYGGGLLLGRPFARAILPDGLLSSEGTRLELSLSSAGPFAVELFVSMLIGGMLLGVPVALLGYRITHAVVARYQARRALRQQRSGLRMGPSVRPSARAGRSPAAR